MFPVQYPIVQAPMYGVTSPEMVAAAANSGCLGCLPLGDLPFADARELIAKTKALTSRPFCVNFFANRIPEITPEIRQKYNKVQGLLEMLASGSGLEVTIPSIDSLNLTSYRDQLPAVLEAQIPVVSFTFGIPDAETIAKLKSAGTLIIGTCTSLDDGMAFIDAGADALCVQGIEAGGHRGAFEDKTANTFGLISLLNKVSSAAGGDHPIIAAGGVCNRSILDGLKSAGADAVQLGSILLLTDESLLADFEKQKLREAKESDLVLTRSFSGRYAQGLRNKFIETLDAHGDQYILPYPFQNKITAPLRRAAKQAENLDFVSIWTGQSLSFPDSPSTAKILQSVVIWDNPPEEIYM